MRCDVILEKKQYPFESGTEFIWDLTLFFKLSATSLIQAKKLVPAMLVGTYLNLLVGNATSGIFSGQGRPLIATILSFGLELPLSIGGVAVYILYFHGGLIGVYWWGAIAAGIEIVIVLYLVIASDWAKCADEAKRRQEASGDGESDDDGNDLEDGETSAATTDLISSSSERSSSEIFEDTQPTPQEDEPAEAVTASVTSASTSTVASTESAVESVAPAVAAAASAAAEATNEETAESAASPAPTEAAKGPLATAIAKKKAGKKKRRGKR